MNEVVKAEFPKDGFEEASPLRVVRRWHVKEDVNMQADVHLLHNSGGSRLRSIWEELGRGRGAGGGVRLRRHGGAMQREERKRKLEFRIDG